MTEFWLSGPVAGVPPALTPAAHAFLQVREDVPLLLADLTVEQLWRQIGHSAPIGYHAVHLAGATDRLMTYARGEQLTDTQLADVRGAERSASGLDAATLVARVPPRRSHRHAEARALVGHRFSGAVLPRHP